MKKFDVGIIGGGLAGLTAAIHLSRKGLQVVVFEKNEYPVHKVCGEYVSNEVLPYLKSLEIDLDSLRPAKIDRLQLGTLDGKTTETELPLGGFGISRFCLDHFLHQKAIENGAQVENCTAENVAFTVDKFRITTENQELFEVKITIGAFGKRANLDKKLHRKFIVQKSPWLALKMHYENSGFPENLVALHHFDKGYCGLSKTETGAVNFCYLASYKNFQKYKDIAVFNEEVVSKNPYLKIFLQNSTPLFEKPLSIAQISFEQKPATDQHILMCGDAAGLIHPLCGNGMAMAIHSAKIASELILVYFNFENRTREWLEKSYRTQWNKTFGNRLFVGNKLQNLFLNPRISNIAVPVFSKTNGLLKTIIKKTHGKPF